MKGQLNLCIGLACLLGTAACNGATDIYANKSERPAADDPIEEIIVEDVIPIPPPAVDIVTVERPSKEHVWVPGYWEREPGRWTWIAGSWVKPPHKYARWHNGYWRWHDTGWRWRPAHWAISDSAVIVDEIIPVPDLLAEDKPPKPSDKNHWVSGHWDWDGHWIWIPGYWTNKPRPNAQWTAGHWSDIGGKWRWVGGHWSVS